MDEANLQAFSTPLTDPRSQIARKEGIRGRRREGGKEGTGRHSVMRVARTAAAAAKPNHAQNYHQSLEARRMEG